MIQKAYLKEMYLEKKKSAKEISILLKCSENKVHYWLEKYKIKKRSISDATYVRANPNGDPFAFTSPRTPEEWLLYGLGLGIYWGEGNKANDHAVRLGNTDPKLIKTFLEFLTKIYAIDKSRLRFGLQIFTDINPLIAKKYWCNALDINPTQFQKIVISKQNKRGTYTRKLQYGVLTVYFSNRKLRDTIVGAIQKLQDYTLPM